VALDDIATCNQSLKPTSPGLLENGGKWDSDEGRGEEREWEFVGITTNARANGYGIRREGEVNNSQRESAFEVLNGRCRLKWVQDGG
jgi:hypothetical protein